LQLQFFDDPPCRKILLPPSPSLDPGSQWGKARSFRQKRESGFLKLSTISKLVDRSDPLSVARAKKQARKPKRPGEVFSVLSSLAPQKEAVAKGLPG